MKKSVIKIPLPWPRALARTSLFAGAFLLSACGEEEQAQQAVPPPAVMVASVEKQKVTPSVTFNGRIEAVDTVDLRARIEGYLEQRHFEEGDDVKAGDLLFMLEKAPYEAVIKEIQGQITAAKGTLHLARITTDRTTKLVKRKLVAQAELDKVNAQYTQALGELQRLQATLERAQLDLSYTDIMAPIDGRISRSPFSVGDFVTPSSNPLATIVSQDPMYVSFPVSARKLLEVRKAAEARGQKPRAVTVKVRLPDGSLYDETGTINFVDVQADPTTDTVTVRATTPNPQRLLVADQLVGVIVEQKRPEQALVIPQTAIAVDQTGPYVLVVNKDSKVEQRHIRTGSPQGSGITITEGLRKGERVIVEGLQKVRPGQVVAVSKAGS